MQEAGRGDLEFDVEDGGQQGASSKQAYPVASKEASPPKYLKNIFKDENPWFSGAIFLTEFTAVVFFTFIVQLSRGFSVGDPILGALGIGGGFAGIYFALGVMFTPVHLHPGHTLLHAMFKNETWFNAFLRIVAQIVGYFAANGISRVLLSGYYINTAIHLGTGVAVGAGLFVELLGEVFFGFVVLQLALYGERGATIPITALIMGIATTSFQAFAYPVSGACFNIFRWLTTNIYGGNSSVYFTEDWWIYLVAPVAGFFIVVMMHLLFKFVSNNVNDWAAKHANYKTI
jgi:glycerol uptake facilitator-like aquaporin